MTVKSKLEVTQAH